MITVRLKEDFQAEPKTVPLKECGDALFASSGSYLSFDCVQHCLNLSGKPYPDLMCRACSQIPFKHDFIERFTRRTENIGPSGDFVFDPKTNLCHLPAKSLLARARTTAQELAETRLLLAGIKNRLTAARERIRTLPERYEDSFKSGNIAKLVSDLRYCDEKGKFEHRESTLSFLKDIVHDLRLIGAEGKRSHNMRWSESSHRIFATIMKFGGRELIFFSRRTSPVQIYELLRDIGRSIDKYLILACQMKILSELLKFWNRKFDPSV
jgi:hypothetical protein